MGHLFEWTRALSEPANNRPIYSDQVFSFGLQRPDIVFAPAELAPSLSDRHSITFWLRHAQLSSPARPDSGKPEPEVRDHHTKEHLACVTAKGSAEHIYALFVRNCKLNLMLRPDLLHGAGLEWRWRSNLNELCDDTWHLYTINVDLHKSSAVLYIDGQPQETVRPIKLRAKTNKQTTSDQLLSVGACWNGKRAVPYGHLNGSIAGLQVLHGGLDEPELIACLAAASDAGLALASRAQLESTGGSNLGRELELNNLIQLRQVSLVAFSPGWMTSNGPTEYSLTLNGSTDCGSLDTAEGAAIEPLKIRVELEWPQSPPTIVLGGSVGVLRNRSALSSGISLLEQLEVRTSPEFVALEGCSLLPVSDGSPEQAWLDEPEEQLLMPSSDEFDAAKLFWHQTRAGVLIFGLAEPANYQALLRKLVYRVSANWVPPSADERSFSLICSAANGLLVSNEHQFTIQLERPVSIPPSQAGHVSLLAKSGKPANQLSWSDGSLESASQVVSFDQSRRLDRIGMAFLVFIISLVVIVVIITLANLRNPHIRSPVAELYEEQSDSEAESVYSVAARPSTTYHDIDSAVAACRRSTRSREIGEEEEREPTSDGPRSRSARIVRCARKLASERSSATEESLAWDNELYLNGYAQDSEAEIVLNPLVHALGEHKTMTVAELRSGGSASMSACSRRRNHDEFVCQSPIEDHEDMLAMDEYTSGSESSYDSSLSESSLESDFECPRSRSRSGSTSETTDTGSPAYPCNKRHTRSREATPPSSLDGVTYELYHRHHVHHACIRRQRQRQRQLASERSSQPCRCQRARSPI